MRVCGAEVGQYSGALWHQVGGGLQEGSFEYADGLSRTLQQDRAVAPIPCQTSGRPVTKEAIVRLASLLDGSVRTVNVFVRAPGSTCHCVLLGASRPDVCTQVWGGGR